MKTNYFLWLLIFSVVNLPLFSQSQPGGFIDGWSNYTAADLGPVNIQFNSTNVRSIEAEPAIGVHPRIYFGPNEIPAIQAKLQNTTSGQQAFAQLHAYTTLMHLGYNTNGTYQHNSSYGSDAFGNKRIDNPGKWDKSTLYEDLISNNQNALDGADNKERYLLASVMALEAFECLMMAGQTDPDTGLDYDTRATMLATAMANWASMVIGSPELAWDNYNQFGGVHMAFAYDLNYNNMSTEQQDLVRAALAAIVAPTPRYGYLTTPYSTSSNWAGLNSFELLTNFAIEGEAGYNPTLTHEYMKAYWNFITYGWYESGSPYEGLGKNYQFVTTMVAAAKRGYSLLTHPHVRAYGNDFLPAVTQPFGHSMIGTDVWGGTGWDTEVGGYKNNAADILGLKYAFPNDTNIDFAWRDYIEGWYFINSTGYVYQSIFPAISGYNNYLLMAAIFAEDYDDSQTWEAQNQQALGGLSKFFPERGLATLRSGYGQEDMMMHFHCRQDMGGHTHADRNSFTLSALGRVWVRYTYGSHFQPTEYHSCVMINDMGIPLNNKDGVKSRQPGKVLAYADNGTDAQITGDATYAYSWEWDWQAQSPGVDHSNLGTNGWEAVTETWNDFRYQQGNEFYHSIPFYDYADWRAEGKLERMVKRSYNPMERVYRTAAVVRGEKPYALIIDDIQKDTAVQSYKWLAQVANDLVIESTVIDLGPLNFRNDIILTEPAGNRKLLIRVLNNNATCPPYKEILDPVITGIYRAGYELESDATIDSNKEVSFFAGDHIILKSGFKTNPNSNFYANIEPCDGNNSTPGYLETITPGINGNSPITRIVIESETVAPDYKVMIFPFNTGDELPVTNWNADRTILTVNWSTGAETIYFNSNNGLTEVVVN